jgi:putative endonuclease
VEIEFLFFRDVAQPGSVPAWGAGGRWFESSRPDKSALENSRAFFMQFFVYILKSIKTEKYYCGQTDNIAFRLKRHTGGEVKSTKHGVPWELIGYVCCDSRAEAMELEKEIKKRGIGRWLHENSSLLKR